MGFWHKLVCGHGCTGYLVCLVEALVKLNGAMSKISNLKGKAENM